MKNYTKQLLGVLFGIAIFFPAMAFAHQPRIPSGTQITVTDPEISKAYYSQLSGQPHIYTINSSKPFALYVNILVPDKAGQKTEVSATVTKQGTTLPIAVLDGPNFTWKKFFEPFGYDSYLMGPEYKAQVDAGTYTITVSSPQNNSKYSLAIGEAEAFNFTEGLNAIHLIPQIKRDFFNESPINFILSMFGWGYILALYILAFIFGFLYRFLLKKFATGTVRGVAHNIGWKDKLLRLTLGILLLLWAITTTWSPWLIFFSGFCFFEAIFSWCGLYAALGKNTCPV
jgi:hypothetical protein